MTCQCHPAFLVTQKGLNLRTSDSHSRALCAIAASPEEKNQTLESAGGSVTRSLHLTALLGQQY